MSFLYVGRLDELKGIKVLFEAWKLMGETDLLQVVKTFIYEVPYARYQKTYPHP